MSKIALVFLVIWMSSIGHRTHDSSAKDDANELLLKSKSDDLPRIPALLASRFTALTDLTSIVDIRYFNQGVDTDTSIKDNARVELLYRSNGEELLSVLNAGIKQEDISAALAGTFWDRFNFLIDAPYVVRHRSDLNKISRLARRRPALFGEGDVAFYDLAEASVENITTPFFAYIQDKDSSEKGYINTFNHITAQAFITTYFSEELADFVGDVHERQNMPELVTGFFTPDQHIDPNNNPVDNYVDVINNELAREIGKSLRTKYNITAETIWTAELLTNYLNDIQRYYSWSFRIGMEPFSPEDELMIRFASKINVVAKGVPYHDI